MHPANDHPRSKPAGRLPARAAAMAAQIAGLCATGWLLWSGRVAPLLHFFTAFSLAAQALVWSLVACIWSALLTLGLHLLLFRELRGGAKEALRTARTAVWFAPATILLTSLSPAAIGAAVVLVVSVTRLLYSQWRELSIETRPIVSVPVVPGVMLLPPARLGDLAPALFASAALQASALAFLGRYPAAAAACIVSGVAMLTLAMLAAGVAEPRHERALPQSVFGLLLTVMLATTLIVGALGGFGPGSGGSGGDPGFLNAVRGVLRNLNAAPARTAAPRTQVTRIDLHGPVVPGIILQVDAPPEALSIVLRRRIVIAPLRLAQAPRESSIPFSGLYSIHRSSYEMPPEGSPVEHGTPLRQGYETTDFTSMRMEAYQKLNHVIDLACCRAIAIAISNADRYLKGVDLELILRDTAHDGASRSLGARTVASKPGYSTGLQPVMETLEFPVSAGGPLRQFDQIEVIFHLAGYRADHSARIAIDRFILLPP